MGIVRAREEVVCDCDEPVGVDVVVEVNHFRGRRRGHAVSRQPVDVRNEKI